MRNRPAAATVVALALALSACKSAEERSGGTQKSDESSASTGGSAEKTATPLPAEPAKLEITDDVVKRYLDYAEKDAEIRRETLTRIGELDAEAKAKGSDMAAATAMMAKITDLNRTSSQKQAALRKESGLSETDLNTLQNLVNEVVLGRKLAKDANMETVLAESRAQIEKLPAERRAEAEAQVKKMEDNHQATMNATNARQKFGDAAVDAIIKHEDRAHAIWMSAFAAPKK